MVGLVSFSKFVNCKRVGIDRRFDYVRNFFVPVVVAVPRLATQVNVTYNSDPFTLDACLLNLFGNYRDPLFLTPTRVVPIMRPFTIKAS